ncbi:MAG TPA: type IV pilus secretin PilQ family protein [Luteimonas sp.]|nr:type IV pilus secretin PilQ family protein [Luteimonas sp.]
MTVTNAKCPRTVRAWPSRAALAGLAAGLLAALGSVQAATPATVMATAQSAAPAAVDPARQVPGALAITDIDFKRGDGGSGQLILHFSGEGAIADLQSSGSSVVVVVDNASLPAALARPLDVTDFATPVQRIDANRTGGGARIVLSTRGGFEPMAYQSGSDYIVEVMPAQPRQAVARADGGQTVAVPSATVQRTYTGRPVTFNFQDVPVRTVLQLIADEEDINLVASDSVTGNVTLRLVNVPWDQALDIVLRAKGLDKRRNGNVVWIAPQAEIAKYESDLQAARLALENNAELVTEYIPISYGSAEAIATLLTDGSKGGRGASGGDAAANQAGSGFLSARGSISFDQRTNTLLVIDVPQRVAAIRELVNQLDKPVDQVVIEARIVIANESFARELGARFGISGATGKPGDRSSLGFGGNLDASGQNAESRDNAVGALTGAPGEDQSPPFDITRGLITNLPSTLSGGTGALALSILNAGHLLDIELSAMQNEGRGEIISNPRIVTSNQKEATIRQGDQIGYLTTTGGTQGNLPTVQFKDAILELKVTPTITADGRVFLNMNVIKDDLAGFVETGVGDVPQISTRQVTTSVLVEDGQTVVIGGVYEFKDQQSLSKVPFLADLPLLGNLFKNRNRTKSKAELLIMVTPKVIRVAPRPLG